MGKNFGKNFACRKLFHIFAPHLKGKTVMITNIIKSTIKPHTFICAGNLRSPEIFRIGIPESVGKVIAYSSRTSRRSSEFGHERRESPKRQNTPFFRPFGGSNNLQLSAFSFQPVSQSCTHTMPFRRQQLLPLNSQLLALFTHARTRTHEQYSTS